MAMTAVWIGMVLLSLLCGAYTGQLEQVSQAVSEGAGSAVTLCISMAGMLCLWNGVLEVLRRCGGLEGLRRGLMPLLKKLFPDFAQDAPVLEAVSANFCANLLGLGNAATPFGIQAAKGMAAYYGGVAGDGLCLLVVCNTASLQLLPTTVAALRSGAGCATPFDILPAVWLTSALALAAGLLCAALLRRVWP
jgi:spore maturation protein A